MKVAFDGRILKHKVFTGVENYAAEIFKGLKERFSLLLFQPQSTKSIFQHFWLHTKLPLLAQKSDLLFSPVGVVPLLFTKDLKLIVTIHDVAFLTQKGSVSKFFKIYYAFVTPRSIKKADHIITVSEAAKQEIIRIYPFSKHKITAIHNGVDAKYRVLKSVQKEKQILYVGSINERKNLQGVLDAFEKLPDELNYKLIIVGNFSKLFKVSKKLQSSIHKAKNNKNIIFKGNLTSQELLYEYNRSCALLFPSFYEGFGLPILEAMACGTPVITSNLSSMSEICQDAALYVDPYNSDDIAKKTELLLQDRALQELFRKKGLKHITNFSWEKSVAKHIEVFEKVMES